MRLTMKERRSVTGVVAKRYKKVTKKDKGTILGEYTELTTGYNRCYASFLLRNHGRRIRISNNTVLVGECRKRGKRNRDRTYDEQVVKALKKIWLIMGFICEAIVTFLGILILANYRNVFSRSLAIWLC